MAAKTTVKPVIARGPIRPLADKILVKRLDPAKQTASGIILPERQRERSSDGIVIAVGTGKVTPEGKILPFNVKVGDKVLYNSFAGVEIKRDKEEFVCLFESDLYAIID